MQEIILKVRYFERGLSNRFTDFAFDFLDDREVRWRITKNVFHHHGQIIAIQHQNKTPEPINNILFYKATHDL